MTAGEFVEAVKQCRTCGHVKPLSEFYRTGNGNVPQPYCKTCDNRRERRQTPTRIARRRARQRATADLIRAHHAEFEHLLDFHLEHARTELEFLDASERVTPEEPTRLRPGPRRPGEDVADRVDADWSEVVGCADCSAHHSHGHSCASCGAAPGAAPQPEPEPVLEPEPVPVPVPVPVQVPGGGCVCVHPARRHSAEDGCLISDCPCTGHPELMEAS